MVRGQKERDYQEDLDLARVKILGVISDKWDRLDSGGS
jgi:hypothetical protein